MAAADFGGEPGPTVSFLLEFLEGIKLSIPERIHSEIRAASLKKFRRVPRAEQKSFLWKVKSRNVINLESILTLIKE